MKENRRQNPSKLRDLQDGARRLKDAIFSPLSRLMDKLHIPPVVLSIIGFLFGSFGAFFLLYSTKWALICIIGYFFFDNADGALARYNKVPTLIGWWQDYILDRILRIEFAIAAIMLSSGLTRQILIWTIFAYLFINTVSVITKDRYHINLDYTFYALLLININLAMILAIIELVPGIIFCIYRALTSRRISFFQAK